MIEKHTARNSNQPSNTTHAFPFMNCSCACSGGAKKKRGIDSHFVRPLTPKEREEHNRRYVIFCALEARPFSLASGAAFRYFVGGFSPSYASQVIHPETVTKLLTELSAEVKAAITAKLSAHHDSVTKLGWHGPFVGIQMDMTTAFNTEYITVALSYVSEEWCMERLTVCTKAFPGRHTQDEIEAWLREVSLVLCMVVVWVKHRFSSTPFWQDSEKNTSSSRLVEF